MSRVNSPTLAPWKPSSARAMPTDAHTVGSRHRGWSDSGGLLVRTDVFVADPIRNDGEKCALRKLIVYNYYSLIPRLIYLLETSKKQ